MTSKRHKQQLRITNIKRKHNPAHDIDISETAPPVPWTTYQLACTVGELLDEIDDLQERVKELEGG